jgi:flagellar hook protein FlgE
MFNSFSAALSALKAHSAAVDAVGNNLANVNTTGFKSSDVAFKDVVAESLSGHSETGMGVSRPTTIRNFSQGAIQSTSGALDSAMQGNGFFVVNDSSGQRLLTRDGSFTLDKAGYVVTLTGERVQQYAGGALSDIQIPTGTSAASPTTAVNLVANLNASAQVGDTFSTPIEAVDSLGTRHMLTFQFTKKADNSWDYDVKIPAADIGAAGPGPVSIFTTPPTTTIDFDANGKMTAPAAPGTISLTVASLADKAADLSITWSLLDSAGQPTVSQFAEASSVSKTNADGYPAAEVVSVGMADGGKVIAKYGNGQEKSIATLAVALVANPSSLTSASNNNYKVTSDSAAPVFGTAETGGRGKVKAGALEASTVDIAREFTNLIVYQRGYQANSRVITTTDEISQETLNLKR